MRREGEGRHGDFGPAIEMERTGRGGEGAAARGRDEGHEEAGRMGTESRGGPEGVGWVRRGEGETGGGGVGMSKTRGVEGCRRGGNARRVRGAGSSRGSEREAGAIGGGVEGATTQAACDRRPSRGVWTQGACDPPPSPRGHDARHLRSAALSRGMNARGLRSLALPRARRRKELAIRCPPGGNEPPSCSPAGYAPQKFTADANLEILALEDVVHFVCDGRGMFVPTAELAGADHAGVHVTQNSVCTFGCFATCGAGLDVCVTEHADGFPCARVCSILTEYDCTDAAQRCDPELACERWAPCRSPPSAALRASAFLQQRPASRVGDRRAAPVRDPPLQHTSDQDGAVTMPPCRSPTHTTARRRRA